MHSYSCHLMASQRENHGEVGGGRFETGKGHRLETAPASEKARLLSVWLLAMHHLVAAAVFGA